MNDLNTTKYDNVKKSIRISLKYLAIIIVARVLWGFFSLSSYSNKNVYTPPYKPSINEIIVYVADSLNNRSPVWTDSVTELTGVILPDYKTIQYNFDFKINPLKYNIPKLKEIMDTTVFEASIKGEGFRVLKDSGVTIIYNYCDTGNRPLFKLVYTPDRYKGV